MMSFTQRHPDRRWLAAAIAAAAAIVLSLTVGPSVARAGPIAQTLGSTGVTATEATVWGDVDPGSDVLTYYFDYGTTDSYGSSTDPYTANPGGHQFVGASLWSLLPATTYHYRIVAMRDGNVIDTGDDWTFTTLPAPIFSTGAATDIGLTMATLTGTVNPNGVDTGYSFEYGTTTAYGSWTATVDAGSGTADLSVTAKIRNLMPNTSYHYALVAWRDGLPTWGNDQVFTTAAAPTPDPVVITGAWSAVGTTTATVAGAVDPSGYPASYAFEYSPSNGPVSRTPLLDAGSGTAYVPVSATLTGLSPGTIYQYRLVVWRGVTLAATGAYGSFVTATAPPAPVTVQDLTPPKLTAMGLAPRTFKAANSGPSLMASGKAGTRVTFTLTEAATVSFRIERAGPGRMVNGRCRRQTGATSSGKPCTYYMTLPGGFTWHGKLGVNVVRLTGRLNNRRLASGSYRLVGTPRDASGNVGPALRIAFTIT